MWKPVQRRASVVRRDLLQLVFEPIRKRSCGVFGRLILILLMANNRTIMGKRVNGRLSNMLGWLTVALMSAAAIALILTWGHA